MSTFRRLAGETKQRAARFRVVLPIMIGICAIGTGNTILTTKVSLHLSEPSISSHVVELVLTAFPLGFLVGCLVARPLVSRLGHERTFLVIGLLAASAAGVYTLTTAATIWFCLRLLTGFAMATLFVTIESWINLYADQSNRGALFSLYMLMSSLAVLFGQLIVEAAGADSPFLFLFVLISTSSGLFCSRFAGKRWPPLPKLLSGDESSMAPARGYALRQLVRLAPVTVVSVFQAGMANMNVYTMTPIYGERVGLDAALSVSLITAFSVGGLLAQGPIGWLSDRMDRRLLLLLQGFATTCVCASIAMLEASGEGLLCALFFAYGATALTIYPVSVAYANTRLASRDIVSASGSLLLLYSMGNLLAPAVAAGLMDRVSPHALFILLGSGALSVAVAALFSLLRRRGTDANTSLAPCEGQ